LHVGPNHKPGQRYRGTNKMTNNKYLEQAQKFLTDTNTTLTVIKSVPQKAPLWDKDGKHGIYYSCTLENKNHKYTFDFWDSIANAEYLEYAIKCKELRSTNNPYGDKVFELLKENKMGVGMLRLQYDRLIESVEEAIKPNAYDILACLSPLYEDNFKDFTDSFGYDSDSITALKIFEACKEQDRNLRKLWDRSELEALTEIN